VGEVTSINIFYEEVDTLALLVPIHVEPAGAALLLDDKPVVLSDGGLVIPPRPVDTPRDMSSGALNTDGCRHVNGIRVITMDCDFRLVGPGRAHRNGCPLIRLATLRMNTKETTMSQKAHQNPAPKHTPTSEKKQHDPPITGVSPDDPIEVTSPNTGKTRQ
jgi:hypothetical protein